MHLSREDADFLPKMLNQALMNTIHENRESQAQTCMSSEQSKFWASHDEFTPFDKSERRIHLKNGVDIRVITNGEETPDEDTRVQRLHDKKQVSQYKNFMQELKKTNKYIK